MKRIYDQLRGDIISGKFKPGEHLSEKRLTQEYGISRASTREVIGQLASQGFLTVEPNRGATVTKLSLEDVEIIYNILVRCEPYAARLLARRQNPVAFKKLNLLHQKMKAKKVLLKRKIWLQLNDNFHHLICTSCGSKILADLIHQTRLRIYRFRLAQTDIKSMEFYNEQHRKLLKAMHAGNGAQAEKIMAHHLKTAEKKHRFQIFREYPELI